MVDVELDQIVTFHRMGLANLYAYFIKQFLGGISISLNTLVHGIIHLKAIIKETETTRNITLQKNKKDPKMMKLLHAAIEKINELNIYGPTGELMKFTLENV
jgi:KaiC/GvpD/RAD55 family RecA-like ATPase